MGSALAGAKSGLISSLYFAGTISVFNILLLLSFKNDVLALLAQPGECPTSAEACFSTLIFPGVPLYDFVRTFVIALLFGISIGIYFDFLPGPTYFRKTTLGSLIMLLVMLFLGLYGIVTTVLQQVLMVSFETVSAIIYALVMARLYRRFTREVEFQSTVPSAKIIVDRRDLTGKKRTFAVNSIHKVEASTGDKPFKAWLVSGGVQMKEPKQSQSGMLVTGDGLLKLA